MSQREIQGENRPCNLFFIRCQLFRVIRRTNLLYICFNLLDAYYIQVYIIIQYVQYKSAYYSFLDCIIYVRKRFIKLAKTYFLPTHANKRNAQRLPTFTSVIN